MRSSSLGDANSDKFAGGQVITAKEAEALAEKARFANEKAKAELEEKRNPKKNKKGAKADSKPSTAGSAGGLGGLGSGGGLGGGNRGTLPASTKESTGGSGFDFDLFDKLVKRATKADLAAKIANAPAPPPRRKFKIHGSMEKVLEYPLSPRDDKPDFEEELWSPRTVTGNAVANLAQMTESKSAPSRVRQIAMRSMEKTLPCRLTVHDIVLDPVDMRYRTGPEFRFDTMVSVRSRKQRLLTSDEICEKADKSVRFFKKNQEINAVLQREEKLAKGAWSKLRVKFLQLDAPPAS